MDELLLENGSRLTLESSVNDWLLLESSSLVLGSSLQQPMSRSLWRPLGRELSRDPYEEND